MALPIGQPIISPALVGRGPQVDTIERCLNQASAGRGQVLLISGEAGIGKSRLVEEARSGAAGMGFQVQFGRCFESDREYPYAPLLDLLRTASTAQPSRSATRPPSDFARRVMDLLELHPSTARAAHPDRPRHFLALIQLFTEFAAAQPLLMTIEDVHWADDASLDFLRYLARRIAHEPILLVLTYRGDEVRSALASMLVEVDRERIATELALPRLAVSEVDQLLRAIFALRRPVRAEFLEAIYALTDGNPFFVEEVLRALVSDGDIFYGQSGWDRKPVDQLRIPRSVQEAVRRRLERLGGAGCEILELAAVAGRRFHFTLLQALTGRDEHDLVVLLKEGIAAQLVIEESADQFAFRHALTRQAVYTRLLARERRALHQRIAETLERLSPAAPDGYLVELAYHSYEAGDWGRTLDYARRAGERAQALYAPRASVQQFSRALESAQHLALQPSVDLYQARGSAYETLGEFDHALADYTSALDAARTIANRPAEWQALLDLAALWMGRDNTRGRGHCEEALRLAEQLGDRTMLARSLNRLGNCYVNGEQLADGLRLHREALLIAA